jgi:hypothetical protein
MCFVLGALCLVLCSFQRSKRQDRFSTTIKFRNSAIPHFRNSSLFQSHFRPCSLPSSVSPNEFIGEVKNIVAVLSLERYLARQRGPIPVQG